MEQRREQDFRPVAVLNGVAINYPEEARRLREIAASAAHLSFDQRETLTTCAQTLDRLDKLRQDLLTTASNDSEGEDNLTADLMSLLGLESGS